MWRRSNRLGGYDYGRTGAYFVTACLDPRRPLLGSVTPAGVRLTVLGDIVAARLLEVPCHVAGVQVDEWIVMPDHVHVVFLLGGHDVAVGGGRHASPLRVVVGSFKAAAARDVNLARATPGAPFWQRVFYDHIVRDEADLQRVRSYIRTNPERHVARTITSRP